MKKLFFLLVCISTGIFSVFSHDGPSAMVKGNFSGIVMDGQTKQALPGASVFIADMKTGAITDANGHFEIRNIPEGTHLVEVSHIGYNTVIENVNINGATQHDFYLQEAVVENNAVIVTGSGAATQLKKSPFQVSVMKRDELIQQTSGNIIEALTKIPGVSSLSTGPAISKPVIRGLGYNRVLTINDGVRQEGQQWGDEHGIEIDEASVNKVELLKGPASLVYGSDATAGVVNIITNVPVANNTIKGNIFSGYNTNNNSRLLHGNLAGNINGASWNLYGSTIAAADYRNRYDGRVFNSKFNQHNFGGYGGYNGNWGFSHLLFSSFNLTTGLVEGERDDEGFFIKPVAGGGEVRANNDDFISVSPEVPYQQIRHTKIASDNHFKIGRHSVLLNIGYQRNRRDEFGNADNTNEKSLSFDLQTLTYTARLLLKEMQGWKTTIGLNGMKQQNRNEGLEQLIPDYELFDIGGYAYTQKTIRKVSLSGGLRYDTRHLKTADLMEGTTIKGNAFSRNFSNFSASIGAAIALDPKFNLKINLARGFRAPSVPELASNGAHEGTIRYEYGDNNIKSETSTQFDAGIDYNTEHISFGISAYINHFDNFIFYRRLLSYAGSDSLVDVDGTSLQAFTFSQQKATLSGMEVNLDFHPHPLDWLHIENTFSFVSGRLQKPVDHSAFLPFIPAPRMKTEFRAAFKKVERSLRNAYLKFEIDNTFTQDRIFSAYNTETATNGYTLLNAGIGTDIVNNKGKTLFTLSFSANNLGDIAYQNHLSRLKYSAENQATGRSGVFNMGRNFSVRLNIPFSLPVVK